MSNKKQIKNAVIGEVFIGMTEENILTAWVILNFGIAKQGFGGLDLSIDGNAKTFLVSVLNVVGVPEVKQLVGKAVRVEHDHSKVYAIGNFIDDKWYHIDGKPQVIDAEVVEVTRPAELTDEEKANAATLDVVVDEEGKKHYGLNAEPGKMGASIPTG